MTPFPIHLPTLQNWSCHNCGGCCRQHAIAITPEEKSRIESQKWTPADGIPATQPLFSESKSLFGGSKTFLAHQPDGACVFLNEKGLCKIHAKFGEPAKPLACRIYPYAFHPSGNEITVSLRFSCPSVAANRGRSLLQQKSDIREMSQLVVPEHYQGRLPPKLTDRSQTHWEDTLRIVESLDHSMGREATPVAVKLLQTLFWLDLISKAKLHKIQGERLQELLELLTEASTIEISELPEAAPPSAIAQSQFRLLCGQYARKDTADNIDLSFRGRWRQIQNATRLAKGTGSLPPLHEGLAEIPFSALEAVRTQLTPESEEMLTRYFRVKIQGMHFCGAAYYNIPVAEGFQSLSLVYPAVLWIAKWLAASESKAEAQHDHVLKALTIVDHQHAYLPALGQWAARRRVKNLVASEDLQKLIVWIQQTGDGPENQPTSK
ncbi:YkgJ family cysteine cluster protein [Planctomicrobium sp. SH668]|uniref:YkgJ family cysteine cluster protein n=1 Tax=Planctomicrobium sp. SH668 TaxID=3448126 RepID=UPI003F5C1AD5